MTIAVNRPHGAVRPSAPSFETPYAEVVPAVRAARMRLLEQRWMSERHGTPDDFAAMAGGRLASVVARWQSAGPLRVAGVAGGGGGGGGRGAAPAGEVGGVVDAVVGWGLRGGRRAGMESAIRDVNRLARRIVAADVPSGMDADTG